MDDGGSNLERMKESLREGRKTQASVGGEGARSPQDFYPSRLRIQSSRKNGFGAAVGRVVLRLAFAASLLVVFCSLDLGAYRQWGEAKRVLSVLRSCPGDKAETEALKQLAGAVGADDVELKSGLLGILAVRAVGIGPRDAGFHACREIVERFPKSWFAGQFSENSFFVPCEACKAQGNSSLPCYLCKGTGRCPRCGGRGGDSTSSRSRPSGNGTIRNTGQFEGMEASCLTCHGTGRCMKCSGRGTVGRDCPECGGAGRLFSTQKATVQYRLAIDNVTGLHYPWLAGVARFQSVVKAWMPFFGHHESRAGRGA